MPPRNRDALSLQRFTQEALKMLDFPMAKPWPDIQVAPAPLDGRSLTFTDDEQALAIAAYAGRLVEEHDLAALPRTFLVMVRHDDLREGIHRRFLNAVTVFAVTPEEIIRFQPVLVERRFLRAFGGCLEGMIYEIDESYVTAWDGTPMPGTGYRN
jgi:hypothetical protein